MANQTCWLFLGSPICADPRELDLSAAGIVVCADSGASHALRFGLRPNYLIGDLDSLGADTVEKLKSDGCVVEQHPVEKDLSDLELSLKKINELQIDDLVVFGASGGRIDYSLNNLCVLAEWWRSSRPYPQTLSFAEPGEIGHLIENETRTFKAKVGARVSLVPFSREAIGVTTSGLKWALNGEQIEQHRSRTLSNCAVEEEISVAVQKGMVMVVIEN